MMQSPKTSPRSEYLLQERLRVQESSSLLEKFPQIKSLTLELGYYDSEGRVRNSHIRYTANLVNAKSIFRIGCQNGECVGGNYDLSDALVKAVMTGETNVSGEIRCCGWRSRTTIDRVLCGNLLRYTLLLSY